MAIKRALFLGRFQPYHKGHQAMIEHIARRADELIIAVGSAQWSHDLQNPFTAGERIMMITRALQDLELVHYVLPIEDIECNALYVAHIASLAPPFDVVYSNNPLVVRLFEEAGYPVEQGPLVARERYWGTRIRRLMVEGEAWRELVPEPVAQVIEEIKGLERLRQLNRRDTAAAESLR